MILTAMVKLACFRPGGWSQHDRTSGPRDLIREPREIAIAKLKKLGGTIKVDKQNRDLSVMTMSLSDAKVSDAGQAGAGRPTLCDSYYSTKCSHVLEQGISRIGCVENSR